MFIKRPDITALKDAEINELRARVRMLESQKLHAERTALLAQSKVDEVTADCPECADICALEYAVMDSNRDVQEIQNILKNELCGNYYPKKFRAKGLGAEFKCLQDIVTAQLASAEYDLAMAAHNLAFCKAEGSEEYIENKTNELADMIESNPSIDDRCMKFINKILSLCA